jgi:hypothetical protein
MNAGQPKSQKLFQSRNLLCYKREQVKKQEKENHPTPPTLFIYSSSLPLLNHSSCSDVPSESHPMILHTSTITPDQFNDVTLPDVATPQTTSISSQIIPPPSHYILRVSQCLCHCVRQFLPHNHRSTIIIPTYLCTSSNCDSIPL